MTVGLKMSVNGPGCRARTGIILRKTLPAVTASLVGLASVTGCASTHAEMGAGNHTAKTSITVVGLLANANVNTHRLIITAILLSHGNAQVLLQPPTWSGDRNVRVDAAGVIPARLAADTVKAPSLVHPARQGFMAPNSTSAAVLIININCNGLKEPLAGTIFLHFRVDDRNYVIPEPQRAPDEPQSWTQTLPSEICAQS
jgi:hypothetical protein